MFALRNKGGREAVKALGDAFASQSALLKHEIAYVLGQMQDAEAVSTLRWVVTSLNHASAAQVQVEASAAEHVSFLTSSSSLCMVNNMCGANLIQS